MNDTYASADALRKAVTDRARQRSADKPSISTEKQLRQFAYNRFLARIFAKDAGTWVLKGGIALLARLPDARHTRDIDLARTGTSVSEAIAELESLVEADLDDYFEFRLNRPSRELTGAHTGTTVNVVSYLGIKEFVRFNVDIVVGLNTTVEPDVIAPYQSVDVPGITDVAWRTFPLVDHVADKFAATLEIHGPDGSRSSRYRDLVDIVLIAISQTLDGRSLRTALLSEFRLRGITINTPFVLPNSHEWKQGYEALANELTTLNISFENGLSIANELLSVVNRTDDTIWNPVNRHWVL